MKANLIVLILITILFNALVGALINDFLFSGGTVDSFKSYAISTVVSIALLLLALKFQSRLLDVFFKYKTMLLALDYRQHFQKLLFSRKTWVTAILLFMFFLAKNFYFYATDPSYLVPPLQERLNRSKEINKKDGVPLGSALRLVYIQDFNNSNLLEDLSSYQKIAEAIVANADNNFWVSEMSYSLKIYNKIYAIESSGDQKIRQQLYKDLSFIVEPIGRKAYERCKNTGYLFSCFVADKFLRNLQFEEQKLLCLNGVNRQCGDLAVPLYASNKIDDIRNIEDLKAIALTLQTRCRETKWYGCSSIQLGLKKLLPKLPVRCSPESVDGCFLTESRLNLESACRWGSFTGCITAAWGTADASYWFRLGCRLFPNTELNWEVKHNCEGSEG